MAFVVHGGQGAPSELAPIGLHRAVCVDVIDKGTVQGQYGPCQLVKLLWEIEPVRQDGSRFIVGKLYYLPIGQHGVHMPPGSKLCKELITWRGRDFTPEEFKEFDLEKIIGAPCELLVVQEPDKKPPHDVWANIKQRIKLTKGKEPLKPSGKYKRQGTVHTPPPQDGPPPEQQTHPAYAPPKQPTQPPTQPTKPPVQQAPPAPVQQPPTQQQVDEIPF